MGGTSREGGAGKSGSLGDQGCLTRDTVLQQLDRILASPGFVNTNRLARFLRVIVEQAVSGHGDELKEYGIGISVFDREESFDPRIDPIVRVEAGRLRSRLREYYRSTGIQDPIVIEIPKGHYLPVFRSRDARGCPARNSLFLTLRQAYRKAAGVYGAWILASIAGLATLIFWHQNWHSQNRLPIARAASHEFAVFWGPFFAPGASNIVVVGAPAFFTVEGTRILVGVPERDGDHDLGSPRGFADLQRRFGPLSGPTREFASLGDLIAVQRLVSCFGQNGAVLRAQPAHQVTWSSLRDHNLVFLGSPRLNTLLASLPVHQGFEWTEGGGIHDDNPRPGEQQEYETTSERGPVAYALLGRYPGLRAGREIQLLSAQSSAGTLAAVDFVTHIEGLREIGRRIDLSAEPHQYYEVLLRVFVDDGTFVQSEYLTYHPVPQRSTQP